MKKITKFLFLFVLGFAFVLVGCTSNLEMPSSEAKVYGNGGSVVQKGEYLYFANSYTPFSSLNDASAKNDDKQFGIYRVKLSGNSLLEIEYDENGFPKQAELVVSLLSGFESTGMYIVGDYLFFASPNMSQTSSNQHRYDFITFYSVKLDGSGLKKLHTTFSGEDTLPSELNKIEWKIYTVDETSYLITLENKKIVRHTISKNSLKDKTVLAEDVKTATLPDNVYSDFDKNIYYVTDFSEDETKDFAYSGSILKKVDFVSGTVTVESKVNGETVSVLKHQNSAVFYTIKSSDNVKEGLYVIAQGKSAIKIANTTLRTNLFYLGEGKPVVFTSNSKVFAQNLTRADNSQAPNLDFEELISSNVTILFVAGDYVYYTDGSNLNRISYQNKQVQNIIAGDFEKGIVDFDGTYIYVFKTLENSETTIKYLQRIKANAVETSQQAKFEVVASVLENDQKAIIKAKEEAEKENTDK